MPKNLRKRDGIWQARFTYKGQYIEKSLETQDLTEARKRLDKLRLEASSRVWGTAKHTMAEAMDKFQTDHMTRLRPNSARRYTVSFSSLRPHFRHLQLNEVNKSNLFSFEQKRLAEGVHTATVRRDLSCLSSIFSQAESWGWCDRNPVQAYLRSRRKTLKESAPRTVHWTPEEEARALELAPNWLERLLTFIIDTGLRREEVFGLLWTDVDLARKEVRVRSEVAKSGKMRSVPLFPRALAAIEALPKRTGYVFVSKTGRRYSPTAPSVNEALTRLCARANVTKITLHDARRTAGIRMLRHYRFSLPEISLWLGHSSIAVTQAHYSFLAVDDLHSAVARSSALITANKRDQKCPEEPPPANT